MHYFVSAYHTKSEQNKQIFMAATRQHAKTFQVTNKLFVRYSNKKLICQNGSLYVKNHTESIYTFNLCKGGEFRVSLNHSGASKQLRLASLQQSVLLKAGRVLVRQNRNLKIRSRCTSEPAGTDVSESRMFQRTQFQLGAERQTTYS